MWFCTALTNPNPNPKREICVTFIDVHVVWAWLVNNISPLPPIKLCSALATDVSCNTMFVDSTLPLRLVQFTGGAVTPNVFYTVLDYLIVENMYDIIEVVPWRHEENFQPLGLNWFFWQFPTSPSCCCHRLKQSPPFLEQLKQESLRSSKCPKSTYNIKSFSGKSLFQ